ncbi:MAG: DEAD/DEAH box helicase [Deltaproteobacteria bacterium]|nr:DEAD/DEAH box helicase [Deltaproteobacteria bacterium]
MRYGEGDRAATLAGLGAYDLLIVSYGLLAQDIDALAKVHFSTAVLDEAQAIKNATTQRAKAARRISAACRVVTTGTPVENHLGEIWSQMHFLNPGLLGGAKQFEERFGRPVQRDGDKEAAAQLRRLLRPFILRRTKSQVLEELPPKTEIVLRVTPSGKELAFYEAVRQRALARVADGKADAKQRMRLLGELMRLRRAACHPRLVDPKTTIESAKLEGLLELIRELREAGHKALVFSQFVGHLTLVRERLDAANVVYQYLDGRTPTKKREAAVAAFQRGEGDLFLISLRAGGLGLNLTAADYVIHLDPWWNPAVEDQASDRAHRIGQRRPVTIYKLVMAGTIEERILEMHGDKRELAAQLLAGSETSTTLSVEQLRELLQSA